jgi:hypothetical protein
MVKGACLKLFLGTVLALILYDLIKKEWLRITLLGDADDASSINYWSPLSIFIKFFKFGPDCLISITKLKFRYI